LPSIDLHAHVDVTIDPAELTAINAVVFAVTRSLDEADTALRRRDRRTIWGIGCHPGLVGSQRAFSPDRFRGQLALTPFVGELGLDGKSRVPIAVQRHTLASALSVLHDTPRIMSLHSYAATAELLDVLADYQPRGLVLHWWLGTPEQTARAVTMGCYFSINSASVRRTDLLDVIPLERLLPETDHPFGDRGRRGTRRPGYVADVETAIARRHGVAVESVRVDMWRNLHELVAELGVASMFPAEVRALLASLPTGA
jgi:TatD DNase family protein